MEDADSSEEQMMGDSFVQTVVTGAHFHPASCGESVWYRSQCPSLPLSPFQPMLPSASKTTLAKSMLAGFSKMIRKIDDNFGRLVELENEPRNLYLIEPNPEDAKVRKRGLLISAPSL